METRDVCTVLQYCTSADDLAYIEDTTRAHTARDLTWHTWCAAARCPGPSARPCLRAAGGALSAACCASATWPFAHAAPLRPPARPSPPLRHIWSKLYLTKYGPLPPNSGFELEPLPGQPPLDYENPVTQSRQGEGAARAGRARSSGLGGLACATAAPGGRLGAARAPLADPAALRRAPRRAPRPGHWRALYEAKTADIEARMAAVRGRLRGSYAVEAALKSQSAARETSRLPPPKRGRGGAARGGAVAAAAGRGAGGAAKIMGKPSEHPAWMG